MKKTPLNQIHRELGARMVDFGGWDMPLHYGSQVEEHHAVRNSAGAFDVSHMTVVDVAGAGSFEFLQHLLANDVAKITQPGKAMYTCMLNESGGVIDDLIVYFFDAENYRLVVNAATREKDLAWIREHAEPYDVRVSERALREIYLPVFEAAVKEALALGTPYLLEVETEGRVPAQ